MSGKSVGKAEIDAVGKQQHTPAHHHYDARTLLYTYGAPLIVAAALRRHPPARAPETAAG